MKKLLVLLAVLAIAGLWSLANATNVVLPVEKFNGQISDDRGTCGEHSCSYWIKYATGNYRCPDCRKCNCNAAAKADPGHVAAQIVNYIKSRCNGTTAAMEVQILTYFGVSGTAAYDWTSTTGKTNLYNEIVTQSTPVITFIDAYGSGGAVNHATITVGVSHTNGVVDGVYLMNPWSTWPDAKYIAYDEFCSLWWTSQQGVYKP